MLIDGRFYVVNICIHKDKYDNSFIYMLNFVVIIIVYGGEKDHNNRFIPFRASRAVYTAAVDFFHRKSF